MGLREKFTLVIAFLISGTAGAQELSEVPTKHNFWDAANKTLFASHAVLEALEFGITHRNLSDGGREMESMAKALRESGTAGQLVFFGGRMAGVVGISYLLHRTGHHKLERAFAVYVSGEAGILRMGWIRASLAVRVGGWAETN